MATLSVETSESLTEVSFSGDLDIYAVTELYEHQVSKIDISKTLMINLADVSSIDTAGAQLLLYLTNKAQKHGQGAEIMSVSDAAQAFFDSFNFGPHLPFSGLIIA